MSATLDHLIYMANQIARNLAHTADPAAAVASHIATYWDPRMKALILQYCERDGTALDANARAAIAQLSATSPVA